MPAAAGIPTVRQQSFPAVLSIGHWCCAHFNGAFPVVVSEMEALPSYHFLPRHMPC